MRIGLDIDNVVADFDEGLLKEYRKEDKKKRNRGIVNPRADHISKGMFDWSEEEVEQFFIDNMERIAAALRPLKGAREGMETLINQGHELYLISHRASPHYRHPKEVTEAWLLKHQLPYTALILSQTVDKSPECLSYAIDVFFDDSITNCLHLEKARIPCYLMETRYNKNQTKIPRVVKDWPDLLKKIEELSYE